RAGRGSCCCTADTSTDSSRRCTGSTGRSATSPRRSVVSGCRADRPSAGSGGGGSAEPGPKARRAERVRRTGPHGPAEQTRRPGSGCPPPPPGCYACGDSSLSPSFIKSPSGAQHVSHSLPLHSPTRAARLRGQQFLIIRRVGRVLFPSRGLEGECFRKPTTSSATDFTGIGTRADVLRQQAPAVPRGVASAAVAGALGLIEKKGRLAVRIRRRLDRNCGKGREPPRVTKRLASEATGQRVRSFDMTITETAQRP